MTTGHDGDPFASWEASLQNETAAEQQEPAALDAPAEALGGPREPPTAQAEGEGTPAQIDSLAAVFIQSESAPPALPEDRDLAAAPAQDDDAAAKAAAITAFEGVLEAEIALAAARWAGPRFGFCRPDGTAPAIAVLEQARRAAEPHAELVEAMRAVGERAGELSRTELLQRRAAIARAELDLRMNMVAFAGAKTRPELRDALNIAEARLAGVLALLDPQGQARAPFRRRLFEWEADELRRVVAGLKRLRGQPEGA